MFFPGRRFRQGRLARGQPRIHGNVSRAWRSGCTGKVPSGRGGHVWLFFEEAVTAASARRLGSFVLTETMERHPDFGFASYDRFS